MIPSDHFVKLYNEIFKFLANRGPGELDRYYERVAGRQAFFTLEAFKRDGLKGMYDYWERIRIEENCDMTQCEMWVFPEKAAAEAKRAEIAALRGEDLAPTNFALVGEAS